MTATLKSLDLLLYGVIMLNGLLLAKGQLLSGISVVLGQKHYYIETTSQANFFQASNFCKQLGMSLASIEKAAEYRNLKSILAENDILDNAFWVSGTILGTNSVPYWLGTGKRITYLPNSPTVADGKNCISTVADTFQYAYVTCTDPQSYICEKPVQPTCGKFGQCRYRYIANTS